MQIPKLSLPVEVAPGVDAALSSGAMKHHIDSTEVDGTKSPQPELQEQDELQNAVIQQTNLPGSSKSNIAGDKHQQQEEPASGVTAVAASSLQHPVKQEPTASMGISLVAATTTTTRAKLITLAHRLDPSNRWTPRGRAPDVVPGKIAFPDKMTQQPTRQEAEGARVLLVPDSTVVSASTSSHRGLDNATPTSSASATATAAANKTSSSRDHLSSDLQLLQLYNASSATSNPRSPRFLMKKHRENADGSATPKITAVTPRIMREKLL
ncbi:unnamed protein product, partial [Amoebophrya sp. A120]|eukprot:GSA120T00012371001.1